MASSRPNHKCGVVIPLALVSPAHFYVFIIAKNWKRGKTIKSRSAFFAWKSKSQEVGVFSVSAFDGFVPITTGRRLWLWDKFQA